VAACRDAVAQFRSWPKFSRRQHRCRAAPVQRHSLLLLPCVPVPGNYIAAFLLTSSQSLPPRTTVIEALMVLARVANFFTNGDSSNLTDGSRQYGANAAPATELPMEDTRRRAMDEEEIDDEAARPPYLHVRMPSLHR
jgi:hypothetical protein